MANETVNYKLKKPDADDFYDIEVFNENADIVDRELKKSREVKLITLAAAGWSEEAPYVQTVSAEGVTAEDTPYVTLNIPAGITAEEEKAMKKSAGFISYIDTGDGNVTATCIGKKPIVDVQISLKGV